MGKIGFKNEFFVSEKMDDGSFVVTVLRDDDNFFGISLEGCKFITNSLGFIDDKFTDEAMEKINTYCKENGLDITDFKLKLRCRALNRIISML